VFCKFTAQAPCVLIEKCGETLNIQMEGVSRTYQHTRLIHVLVRIISAHQAARRERQQYENEPR
jgi:uncharacterized DUF497 family protein